MTRLTAHNRAFTLIEIMLASMIGGFVTLVAVSAFVTVSRNVEMVQQLSEQRGNRRSAVRLMRRDLQNLYRGADPQWTKFVGRCDESTPLAPSSLTFYGLWQGKVRPGRAEGDLVEIEYFVRQQPESSQLMRRIWPNPDPEREVGGGLLTVLADHVQGFQIRYYDGQEWAIQWTEEKQELPKLVEVSLVIGEEARKTPQIDSFLVAFSRVAGSEALRAAGQSQGRGNPPEGGGR